MGALVFAWLMCVAWGSPFVDVFSKGEAGYFCIKIPDILVTTNATLLAFGEARMHSCSDYTWTNLVYKRSTDGGATWSPLAVLHSDPPSVIGQATPVQLRGSGRILIPFCRNNSDIFQMYSDDDGLTWSTPALITNASLPAWKWIGTGPPATLQLASGRLITPSYHSSAPHNTDGQFSRSHIMLSDDFGTTWRLGALIGGIHETSECQAVQLGDGSLLLNMRTDGIHRVMSTSHDFGETFSTPVEIPHVIEPFDGCEGSMVRHPSGVIFFSIPNDPRASRWNMTLWISRDDGKTWDIARQINPGRSAYSALAVLPSGDMGLLFEREGPAGGEVFVPDHISFTVAWNATEGFGYVGQAGSDVGYHGPR